jgi:hypothetical protein
MAMSVVENVGPGKQIVCSQQTSFKHGCESADKRVRYTASDLRMMWWKPGWVDVEVLDGSEPRITMARLRAEDRVKGRRREDITHLEVLFKKRAWGEWMPVEVAELVHTCGEKPILSFLTKLIDRSKDPEKADQGKSPPHGLVDGCEGVVKLVAQEGKLSGLWADGRVRTIRSGVAEECFTSSFLQQVAQHPLKWHAVPVGSARKGGDAAGAAAQSPVSVCRSPDRIRYPQGSLPHCIGLGLGSAAHTKGAVEFGLAVADAAHRFRALPDLARFVADSHRQLGYQATRPKRWYPGFAADPGLTGLKAYLLENPSEELTVCRLTDDRGGSSHSVTVWRSSIFDSNEEFALPLTQHNLDRCVTPSNDDDYECTGVAEAYMLSPLQ